jgi:hypothetical protein
MEWNKMRNIMQTQPSELDQGFGISKKIKIGPVGYFCIFILFMVLEFAFHDFTPVTFIGGVFLCFVAWPIEDHIWNSVHK